MYAGILGNRCTVLQSYIGRCLPLSCIQEQCMLVKEAMKVGMV